jgi:tRNA (adenine-N(1)-)-methyltransferase non-catalytic subunit
LGKYGTFSSNQILGRPYHLTFELLDKDDGKSTTELRVVPASELHAETLGSDHAPAPEATEESATAEGGADFDIVGEDGEVIMRNNRLTVDDPSRQTLSMEEIEALKKAGTGSGKEIIEKIMAAHMGIEEKTSFSLAKYTLRKSRKYMKRFTVLPLDLGTLTEYVTEKEAFKIMELREETLGLICNWANVHCANSSRTVTGEDGVSQIGGGRWLVVDDTGGLVTAALAEKMSILYPTAEQEEDEPEEEEEGEENATEQTSQEKEKDKTVNGTTEATAEHQQTGTEDIVMADAPQDEAPTSTEQPSNTTEGAQEPRPTRKPRQHIPQMSASTNTLTVIHPNNQPNISHLKYFGFDTGNPVPSHPLYTHLKSISWLQLLHPAEDPSYIEPETISDDVLAAMKSSKRGNYYKKRRRWEKTKRVVEEARAGGFDGLVVASCMEPKTILKEVVPLVRGGGKVVVFSPNAEPLVELCDYYSKDRRAAYIAREFGSSHQNGNGNGKRNEVEEEDQDENGEEEDDFPVNPTLLLAPSVQTARARHWQVLPQRTHPFMTSKGGAEGYLFTATRVLPVEGKVEARGHGRGKKRKVGADAAVQS